MGFDRQFYRPEREGFTSDFVLEREEGGCCIYSSNLHVDEDGIYYFQFYAEGELEVSVLSPKPYYTPVIHGSDSEVKLRLRRGENKLLLSVKGAGRPYSRLFAADSRPVIDGKTVEEELPCAAACDELFLEDVFSDESSEPALAVDTDGYTPALGEAIKGFGRFGFSKGDGVLDYSMPAFGIVARPFVFGHPDYKAQNMWSFSLLPDGVPERGCSMKVYKPAPDEHIEVDWIHTRWERRIGDGDFISFDYSTLTPTLLIETSLDYIKLSSLGAIGVYRAATLPIRSGFVTKAPSDGVLYDRSRDGKLEKNFIILSRSGRFSETPILLSFPHSPESVIADSDSVRVSFDGAVVFCALTFVFGIEMVKPDELTAEFYSEAVKRALPLHRAALTRPIGCKEYFKLEGERVKILDVFSYRILEDSLLTKPLYLAPLPPPLILAGDEVGEIEIDSRPKSHPHPTKYGPLLSVVNSGYSTYTLPVPEYREPLPFSSKCKEKYGDMLHSDFDEYMTYHTDVDEIPNPGNYSFVFQYALVAKLFAYLYDGDRERLEREIERGLDVICDPEYKYIGPKGRRCLSWYERRDPFSGISFYSTYLHITGIRGFEHCDREKIENAEKVFIEIDWGNAMSLYGAWLGALLSGSFDKLDKSFCVIRRAFDYYLVNMDFACMCAGYAENGTLWNDGTGYGGFLGFVNIADALGSREELEVGLYAYSKMCCMRQGMFLSAQKYFFKYFGTEPWYITKFFHEETDGSYTFLSYPADMIKNNYRREGLYNLTTEGHYKEAFRMYARYLPREVARLLSAAESSLDVSVVGKTDMEVKYHSDRNGIFSEQETYTFLALNLFLGGTDGDTLRRMINDAADNRRISREMLGHYQLSHRRVPKELTRISLLTELDSLGEVRLTAWRGLRIERASYPTLTIDSVRDGAWLEVYSEKPPTALINGRRLDFKPLRRNVYRTDISEGGELLFDAPT